MTTKSETSETTDEGAREVPIVEEDFAGLLKKFKIKPDLAANIAENVSHTGGPNVFEDPLALTKRLTSWSAEIAPAKRKLILEQWFAEKGVEVPLELIEKAGMTTEQIKKSEAEKEKEGQVKYVYDTESRQVRMAKQNEPGGTLEQAKQLKQLAEESEAAGRESPFIPDAAGNLTLNPKARITGIELMAYEMIKKSQERGEPLDPLEAMAQAAEKMKLYREALGGGAGTLPSWLSDPAAFITLIQNITGGREGSDKPSWMTDPVEFIKVIREVSGEGKGDDKVTAEIAVLRKTLDDMREESHKQEIAHLNEQMKVQQEVHQKQMQEIATKIDEMGRPVTGRTEMDILHELATEGIGVIKTEAAGMRGMIKELASGAGLPATKTREEREERKGKYRKALQTDHEIEEIGQRLFFSQS